MAENQLCLCGSGQDYSDCCEPYILGKKTAPTAEALMRSRFVAYAQKDEAYLLSSWDTSCKKRPESIDFSKEEDIVWSGLKIVQCKKGGEKDEKGIVEFKAHYILDGEPHTMHEISRFIKKDHCWFYLDGLVKSVARANQQVNEGKNRPVLAGVEKNTSVAVENNGFFQASAIYLLPDLQPKPT